MANIDELKTLAEQGDSDAQYELGEFYENEKNISEACKWFEIAAEQNHTDSQFKLGFFCRWGDEDFPSDIEKGRFWLTQAAEQGHSKAQFHLGNLCNEEQRFDEAAKWFEKSARRNEERAMFRFALLNEAGLFQGHNVRTAVEYYIKLSETPYNNRDAMVNLGVLYCNGEKIERDAAKGKKLIERCKPFRELEAYDCYRIGALYCTGEINPDKEPTADDLTLGSELLDIAIQDGLVGYHPGNIDVAKQLREVAMKRKAALIEMNDNLQKAQAIAQEIAVDAAIKENCDTVESALRELEKTMYNDSFSESNVRQDLQNRKSLEMLQEAQRRNIESSPDWMLEMAGVSRSSAYSRSNSMSLYEKKNFYQESFDEWKKLLELAKTRLNEMQREYPKNSHTPPLIQRCEKGLSRVNSLLGIVRSF